MCAQTAGAPSTEFCTAVPNAVEPGYNIFFSGTFCITSDVLWYQLIPHYDKVIHSFKHKKYRGADKSLARPTFRCILFDGENISFDAIIVIYINSTNIPPIIIIIRVYEHQNLLSL
jgi:hypothetical protein